VSKEEFASWVGEQQAAARNDDAGTTKVAGLSGTDDAR